MFKLISKVSSFLQNKNNGSTAVSSEPSRVSSVWKDTGKVFYLERTFKLVYQSNSGEVTLEKLSIERLFELLHQLETLPSESPLARSLVANTVSAFEISLCAVTWQENGDNLRIKAIPNAAVLRSKTADFGRAQAIFKHEFQLEHDDILTPTLNHGKAGIFTYNRISIGEFVTQITLANKAIENRLKRTVSVKADNYASPFTQNESSVIENIYSVESTK